MTKQKFLIISLLVFAILISVASISELETRAISRLYDKLVLDNKNHYLKCEELPNVDDVNRTVQENKDLVEQIIKEVGRRNRGLEVEPLWKEGVVTDGEDFYISFSWGESYPDCQNTGRGDIEIAYLTILDRKIIERIINSDTFFGIPYRLKDF